MSEINLISFFGDFFINDLFGSEILGTIFVIMLVLAFITIASTPKAAWIIIPTIIIMAFSTAGYIPVWVAMMMWIVMGVLWGLVMKELMS